MKTISNVLIDTGTINKCGVNKDKQRVKYWAIYLPVILLYSDVTVGKILSVEGQQDQTIQVALREPFIPIALLLNVRPCKIQSYF